MFWRESTTDSLNFQIHRTRNFPRVTLCPIENCVFGIRQIKRKHGVQLSLAGGEWPVGTLNIFKKNRD